MSHRAVSGAVVVAAMIVGCGASRTQQAEPSFPADRAVVRTVYGPASEPLAIDRPTPDSAVQRRASGRMMDQDVVRSVWGPQSDPYATGHRSKPRWVQR
jgi:hypothetical protein